MVGRYLTDQCPRNDLIKIRGNSPKSAFYVVDILEEIQPGSWRVQISSKRLERYKTPVFLSSKIVPKEGLALKNPRYRSESGREAHLHLR